MLAANGPTVGVTLRGSYVLNRSHTRRAVPVADGAARDFVVSADVTIRMHKLC